MGGCYNRKYINIRNLKKSIHIKSNLFILMPNFILFKMYSLDRVMPKETFHVRIKNSTHNIVLNI